MSYQDDARALVTEHPGYFLGWYTVKSLALVAAIAALAYQAGRHAR